jgi:hypothetical protein
MVIVLLSHHHLYLIPFSPTPSSVSNFLEYHNLQTRPFQALPNIRMTLLKLFNASTANPPKDDVGGSNAQLESKGRDQSPSPPMDDIDVGSTEAATPEGSSSVSLLLSKVGLPCLGVLVFVLLFVGAGGINIFKYNSAPAPAAASSRVQLQETPSVADNHSHGKSGKEPSLLCFKTPNS